MTTHEAGWAHAAGALDGPSWLRVPDDVNALHPLLWSGTARRTDDGGVEVGGVDLRQLLAEHSSPAEQTSRDRPSSATQRATVVHRKALPA